MSFGGGSAHEILLEILRYRSRISSYMGENSRETFFSQLVLVYFTQVVPVPKFGIDMVECSKELFEGRDSEILQCVDLV